MCLCSCLLLLSFLLVFSVFEFLEGIFLEPSLIKAGLGSEHVQVADGLSDN